MRAPESTPRQLLLLLLTHLLVAAVGPSTPLARSPQGLVRRRGEQTSWTPTEAVPLGVLAAAPEARPGTTLVMLPPPTPVLLPCLAAAGKVLWMPIIPLACSLPSTMVHARRLRLGRDVSLLSGCRSARRRSRRRASGQAEGRNAVAVPADGGAAALGALMHRTGALIAAVMPTDVSGPCHGCAPRCFHCGRRGGARDDARHAVAAGARAAAGLASGAIRIAEAGNAAGRLINGRGGLHAWLVPPVRCHLGARLSLRDSARDGA